MPNRPAKPSGRRQLPDAIKLQVVTDHLRDIILELGIDPKGKSLADLKAEAMSRAKVSRVIQEQMASTQAYIDGALDSIGYGQPDDIARAKQQLNHAQKNLVIGLAAVQADEQRRATPPAPPTPPAQG